MARGTGLIYGLREQIVNQLRNDIYAGRLVSGQRLCDMDLVESFNVSRTPIREALQQLTQEGLLEAKPNCGVRIASEAGDEIQELIITIRRMVEQFGLRSCFNELGEEDFLQWDEIVERMADACRRRDYPTIAELDLELHHAIIARSGVPDLEMIWKVIVARVRSHFREAQKRYPDPMYIHAEHVEIMEVFRSGDLEAAVEILGGNVG